MIHKVEGIIIRSVDYGEGNKILTLYTKEMGKIGVMAKGAKKTKSRLSAVSQLFTYGIFVYYHGGGLGSLTSGDVINPFREIRQDITKTAWVVYLLELVDRLTEEKERSPALFDMLKKSLEMIQEDKDPEIITRIFELQILQNVGVRPELRWCAYCQREDIPFRAFSIKEGGLLCEHCLIKDEHAKILTPASIRLLRTFSQMDLHRLGNVDVKVETRKQIADVLRLFMDTYLGVTFKSRNFLEHLTQWAGEVSQLKSRSEGAKSDERGSSNSD